MKSFIVLLMLVAGSVCADGWNEPCYWSISNGVITISYAETNAYLPNTNWYAPMREYGLTNAVRELANDGTLCRVLGHNYRAGRPGEGEGSAYGGWYADYHPGVEYRTCRVCGKCETKREEWK